MHTSRPYKILPPPSPRSGRLYKGKKPERWSRSSLKQLKAFGYALHEEWDRVRLGTIAGSEAEETGEVGSNGLSVTLATVIRLPGWSSGKGVEEAMGLRGGEAEF